MFTAKRCYICDKQERYGVLKMSHEEKQKPNSSSEKTMPDTSLYLEKSLGANLDSLDNLFCRRCLVLHLYHVQFHIQLFHYAY